MSSHLSVIGNTNSAVQTYGELVNLSKVLEKRSFVITFKFTSRSISFQTIFLYPLNSSWLAPALPWEKRLLVVIFDCSNVGVPYTFTGSNPRQ